MLRGRVAKLSALTLANVLLPIAVLVFASGFFPYKPVLPGLATFYDVQESKEEKHGSQQPAAIFDRVVFMVVDALRSDFVYGHGSGFGFTQSLIRSGAAIPFTAHATPPTVTMPRVKAITTGSVPSFLDLILNFAESDTSSSLATQDTWLAQIRARGSPLVFYGDDTWLKLFPGEFFSRADGTSSFFVSDFTEVDLNVTRHVPRELAQSDWHAMIMHYLGMDHIGHKTGPQGPNMLPKQREMDDIVRLIYEAVETEPHQSNTLLVLAGDHGMNAGGNHGGSGPGETEPALLFASPKLQSMERRSQYECPTMPKDGTDFHFYTRLEQSDVVPTLAGLLGLPVPKNSLGVYIRELAGLWSPQQTLRLLRQNARQMLYIIRAKYGEANFDERVENHYRQFSGQDVVQCVRPVGDEGTLAEEWAYAMFLMDAVKSDTDTEMLQKAEEAVYAFLHHAQEAMSDTASSYGIPNMVAGMVVAGLALLCVLLTGVFGVTSLFFALVCLLYGLMMFASSYVEEEQHFWYWLTPAWIVLLGIQGYNRRTDKAGKTAAATATVVLLILHRLVVRWNQTGQKHAGEPDIVHTFFPDHHRFMWLLIWATYMFVGYRIHNYSLRGLLWLEVIAFADVCLIVPAIVFKLNFAHADSPELVQDLAWQVRAWSEPFDLVFQARAIFVIVAATAIGVIGLSIRQSRLKDRGTLSATVPQINLAERLHPLLTLFLITQSRAPNVPLFLILETQKIAISEVLCEPVISPDAASDSSNWQQKATLVSTTVLLLSHVYYFCMSGSNSISSIDLSNAYNGVADYNIIAVGVLLFACNWAGPIWWCSTAVRLMQPRRPEPAYEPETLVQANGQRSWIAMERAKLRQDASKPSSVAKLASPPLVRQDGPSWTIHVAHMTAFIAFGLLAVMAACTVLRTHLFIWTVFSPKYLYAMAWAVGWHLLMNIGFGALLRSAARVE